MQPSMCLLQALYLSSAHEFFHVPFGNIINYPRRLKYSMRLKLHKPKCSSILNLKMSPNFDKVKADLLQHLTYFSAFTVYDFWDLTYITW